MEAHGGFLQKKEMVSRTTSPAFHMGVIGGDLGGREFGDKFEALGFAPLKESGWFGLAEGSRGLFRT